jgi:hypothetical protein
MIEGQNERDRWTFDGRHYLDTWFSDVATRDGYGWELEETGPSGRGVVLEAFWDDTTGLLTFTAVANEPLPFRLLLRTSSAANDQRSRRGVSNRGLDHPPVTPQASWTGATSTPSNR